MAEKKEEDFDRNFCGDARSAHVRKLRPALAFERARLHPFWQARARTMVYRSGRCEGTMMAGTEEAMQKVPRT
jgi:hypothetical protein